MIGKLLKSLLLASFLSLLLASFWRVGYWQSSEVFVIGKLLKGLLLPSFWRVCYWQCSEEFVIGKLVEWLLLVSFWRVCYWQAFEEFVIGKLLNSLLLASFWRVCYWQASEEFIYRKQNSFQVIDLFKPEPKKWIHIITKTVKQHAKNTQRQAIFRKFGQKNNILD